MTDKIIPTPCIGICSTVYGDDVCRGCQRTFVEITQWNGYDNHQKRTVLDRIAELKQQVLQKHFNIVDQVQLAKVFTSLQVRQTEHTDSWSQLYFVLRTSAQQLADLSSIGVAFASESRWNNMRVAKAFAKIDEEIYAMACGDEIAAQ